MLDKELSFLRKAMRFVPPGGRVVEIGSWLGDSSEAIATGIQDFSPGTQLFCIDPFEQEFFNRDAKWAKKASSMNAKEFFLKRMSRFGVVFYEKRSSEAARLFEHKSVNLLFIDGNHDYEAVKEDIGMWLPKMKKNAIMCGHDYGKEQFGVTRAVDERFSKPHSVIGSIWVVSLGAL